MAVTSNTMSADISTAEKKRPPRALMGRRCERASDTLVCSQAGRAGSAASHRGTLVKRCCRWASGYRDQSLVGLEANEAALDQVEMSVCMLNVGQQL